MEIEHIEGLMPAPFTPMDPDGSINFEMIDTLLDTYQENGLVGAFICGSTGEGPSLTHTEKKAVITKWGNIAPKSFKVIALVGGTCLGEAQELALHARNNNIYSIAIIAPYYYKISSIAQLVDFCGEVAGVVPDMPFYYYHIPALTGVHFPMINFLEEAHSTIPNLVGIKYTEQNLMDFIECRNFNHGEYDILWGTDEILLAALSVGAKGAVGSTYNYAAPLYHQILDAFKKGDIKQAELLQRKSIEMVKIMIKYGGTGVGKAFMKLIGLDCGEFRKPIVNLSNDQLARFKADLESIGFFEFSSKLKVAKL